MTDVDDPTQELSPESATPLSFKELHSEFQFMSLLLYHYFWPQQVAVFNIEAQKTKQNKKQLYTTCPAQNSRQTRVRD